MTRRDIEARTGRVEQLGGVRRMVLSEGPEKGVEQIEVRTGAGLTYRVSPDRGLDISLTEFGGSAISWQSPNGDVSPAFFEHRGLEWLRTAAGGLLMTCGLRQVGAPCTDNGEDLGIHGRMHHTPASNVHAGGEWEGDSHVMTVAGRVHETRIFGENLVLHRKIVSQLGANVIRIQDRVENTGFEESPLMLLYHFNFGYPLMDESTTIRFPSGRVEPREPETPVDGHDRWESPQANHRERVYYHHDVKASSSGIAEAVISSPRFPICGEERKVEVRLRWHVKTLPHLTQWRMPGQGMHVLGLEPGNCLVGGRAVEREAGRLRVLKPGESEETSLELEIETN